MDASVGVIKKINNAPQTVGKALDILEAFVDAESSLGVTELSHKLKINKSTIYRILQALLKKGYITQDRKTNKYFLGYKILKIGCAILSHIQLREMARVNLEELAKETSQTVRLAILDSEEVVYVDHVEGKDPIRLHLQIGSRGPLHCTAAGKSILAFLNENELENILNHYNFKALTPKTITSIEKLKSQLKMIKKHGYSFCDEEYMKGVRAVGAPILDMNTEVIGSIVIVAPSFRMKLKEVPTFGQQVKRVGLEISRKMGYPI